ncbi:hypothetical protein AAFF_G00388690 [Aldrovandia affinis]|uniref:Tubulin--tyrosine ligase-like protein 9 n=1 Tax=Aldrovandia affinis TaxID=143900 RepID=A0AAD7VYY1_9TELE|nr:hypothetical protein AAFF_G00388690 [Aldrovandia affinis]
MRSEVKELIRDQEKAEVSRAEKLLERLEQEIAELRRRDAELEQLSHTEDHIHFLQSCQSVCAPPGPGDLPRITVNPHVSFEAVRKHVSELKERLEDICKGELVKISQTVKEVDILEPRTREDFLQYSCELTLDPNTANRYLRLSKGNRENAGSKVAYDNGKRKEGEGRGYVRYKCPPTKGEDHVRICHFGNHYELTRKNLMVKNLKRQRRHLERGQPARRRALRLLPLHVRAALRVPPVRGGVQAQPRRHLDHEARRALAGPRHLPVPPAQGRDRLAAGARPGGRGARQGGARGELRGPAVHRGPLPDQRPEVRPAPRAGDVVPAAEGLAVPRHRPLLGARFSLGSIRDQYAHLTNVAVQCTAPDYDPARLQVAAAAAARYLTARHGARAVEALFGEIDNVFVRSLQSVQKVIINDKHCLSSHGYDIILDKGLKPWLIEVNASPSLNATCQQDYELKCRLLEDTLNMVDMEGRLTGREAQVGGFDLLWSDGPVYREDVNPPASVSPFRTPNTHLGCFNDRKSQLR